MAERQIPRPTKCNGNPAILRDPEPISFPSGKVNCARRNRATGNCGVRQYDQQPCLFPDPGKSTETTTSEITCQTAFGEISINPINKKINSNLSMKQ